MGELRTRRAAAVVFVLAAFLVLLLALDSLARAQTIAVAPAFSPAPTPSGISSPTSVTITSSTASAHIYYTTDGSQPDYTSTELANGGSITVNPGETVNAIAGVIYSTTGASNGTFPPGESASVAGWKMPDCASGGTSNCTSDAPGGSGLPAQVTNPTGSPGGSGYLGTGLLTSGCNTNSGAGPCMSFSQTPQSGGGQTNVLWARSGGFTSGNARPTWFKSDAMVFYPSSNSTHVSAYEHDQQLFDPNDTNSANFPTGINQQFGMQCTKCDQSGQQQFDVGGTKNTNWIPIFGAVGTGAGTPLNAWFHYVKLDRWKTAELTTLPCSGVNKYLAGSPVVKFPCQYYTILIIGNAKYNVQTGSCANQNGSTTACGSLLGTGTFTPCANRPRPNTSVPGTGPVVSGGASGQLTASTTGCTITASQLDCSDPPGCTHVFGANSTDQFQLDTDQSGTPTEITAIVDNGTFTSYYDPSATVTAVYTSGSAPQPVCQNCTIENNDFSNIHRVGIESGVAPSPAMTVAYNSYHDPFAPFPSSFAFSANTNSSGSTGVTDNVAVANVSPAGSYIGGGVVLWGNGSAASQNLIQGNWHTGIQYNLQGNFALSQNVIQGALLGASTYISAGCTSCPSTPTQSGNSTSTAVAAVVTPAPSISPTPSGTYSAPVTVTLADSTANTTIYYTTDESTPTVASAIYSAPFSVAAGTTVNAIAMWGQGANPTSYATGYGYVPSTVASALYSAGTTPTLSGVSVSCAGGATSVAVGASLACQANCSYLGPPAVTVCSPVADAYGTLARSWTSSSANATISLAGVVSGVTAGSTNVTAVAGSYTSSPLALTVAAAPPVLGNLATNVTTQILMPNFISSVYAVTGSAAGGYNATAASVFVPAGAQTPGSSWDIGIILAPTPTTQAASWLCHGTYTSVGSSGPAAWVTVPLSGCGTLPASTAYWVAVDINDPANAPHGFWNCGGTCAGSAPTTGNGTYQEYYVSAPYGTYTGMRTTMLPAGHGTQASQYVTLASPLPTLTGGYLANPGPTTVLSVGGSVEFAAFCQYSNGSVTQCYPAADQYGNTVTAFATSNSAVMTVGAIGSAHPGLALGVSAGTANATATLTGGDVTPAWAMTVSALPLPYPPVGARQLRSR